MASVQNDATWLVGIGDCLAVIDWVCQVATTVCKQCWASQNKIQSFINKSKRNGYCSPDLPDFNNLCTSMKVDLFNKVLKIPIHVLHPLLPPPISHMRYGLRPRVHDRTLLERTSNLVDYNFIIRMLYLNAYWLNIGLRYKYVIFLLYVVAISPIVCQNALCHFVY